MIGIVQGSFFKRNSLLRALIKIEKMQRNFEPKDDERDVVIRDFRLLGDMYTEYYDQDGNLIDMGEFMNRPVPQWLGESYPEVPRRRDTGVGEDAFICPEKDEDAVGEEADPHTRHVF